MNWAGSIYLLAVAWPLAKTDIREHRLPNKYTLTAIVIAFVSALAAAIVGNLWSNFSSAIISAVVAFSVSLIANRFASLGMGDVKLITAMSLCLGWFSPIAPLLAVTIAFVVAGLFIAYKMIRRKTRMGQSIPLGPHLLVGFAISLVMSC